MIEVQEIQYGRKYDIGICSVTKRKTQWNDACKDGFKCRQHIGGKPYMVCLNCEKWEGKSKLEQRKL